MDFIALLLSNEKNELGKLEGRFAFFTVLVDAEVYQLHTIVVSVKSSLVFCPLNFGKKKLEKAKGSFHASSCNCNNCCKTEEGIDNIDEVDAVVGSVAINDVADEAGVVDDIGVGAADIAGVVGVVVVGLRMGVGVGGVWK